MNRTIKDVSKNMDKYDFNLVGNTLYSFIWDMFCDKYIELSKFNMNDTKKSVLCLVLTNILKMMHPFMPYVTEEIYGMMPIKESDSIMVANYPIYDKNYIFKDSEKDIDEMLEFVTMFRNKKLELGIGNDFKVKIDIDNEDIKNIIISMLKLSDKETDTIYGDKSVSNVKMTGISIDIIYDNSKNIEDLKNNLEKEKDSLINSINRREKLLSNDNYVNKAPSNIVENERNTLEKEKNRLNDILVKLRNI